MQSNYYIPQKIKVGFQKRSDTYTGKLGFVIYYDEKNILKQETAWDKWRDHKIKPIEFDNIPQKGYVINKNINRLGHHFSSGRTVARIFDSRDFEFEISMDNLFGILMNSDLSKCEIDQECILAWDGNKVVLLPTNCKEYLDSQAHTRKQSLEITTKELIKGATYSLKKEIHEYVYLGYFEWFDASYEYAEKNPGTIHSYFGYNRFMKSKGKKHIFYSKISNYESFSLVNVKHLAECINHEPHENYSEFISKFEEEMDKRKKEVGK